MGWFYTPYFYLWNKKRNFLDIFLPPEVKFFLGWAGLGIKKGRGGRKRKRENSLYGGRGGDFVPILDITENPMSKHK